MVYFLKDDHYNLVKIGYSKDQESLRKRIRTLRGSNAGKLTLLRVIEGSTYVEKRIHAQYPHLRVHGEWFDLTDELLNDIENEQFSFNIEQEILSKYNEGMSFRNIAKILGFTHANVANQIEKLGIEITSNTSRKYARVYDDADIIIERYKTETIKSIADDYNCNTQVIKRLLIENDVELINTGKTWEVKKRNYVWEISQDVVDVYNTGKTIMEVAEYFDSDFGTIRRILYKAGVIRRRGLVKDRHSPQQQTLF